MILENTPVKNEKCCEDNSPEILQISDDVDQEKAKSLGWTSFIN